MVDQFTICVLLYGNHFELAERCIGSIVGDGLPDGISLRIGLNSVCEQTYQLVLAKCPQAMLFKNEVNRHKYPVMREMIHGEHRVTTPYFMWFDDDSYIARPLTDFLRDAAKQMESADLIGSPYTRKWYGDQRKWVRAQPWYRGKDPAARDVVTFMTGGWWTIRTQLLYAYDYPWAELDHCGGDAMLGELCLQHNLRLKRFRDGVHINADALGRESEAIRRGFTQEPIGTALPSTVLKPIVRL